MAIELPRRVRQEAWVPLLFLVAVSAAAVWSGPRNTALRGQSLEDCGITMSGWSQMEGPLVPGPFESNGDPSAFEGLTPQSGGTPMGGGADLNFNSESTLSSCGEEAKIMYFSTTANIPENVTELNLGISVDDGARIFMGGNVVGTFGLGGGALSINGSSLVKGSNVPIAVIQSDDCTTESSISILFNAVCSIDSDSDGSSSSPEPACIDGECCDGGDFVDEGTVCRAAANECDVAEVCTGTDADCPEDGFIAAGVACTSDGNDCTLDTCDGNGECVNDPAPPDGDECTLNGYDGTCDDGSCELTGACAAGGVPLPAGTLCRAAAGVCDVAEVCNGVSPDCPADVVSSSQTICNPSDGFCDIPDYCNGTSKMCPSDQKKSSTVICRASTKQCDPAEYCSGTGDACPADKDNCTELEITVTDLTNKPLDELDDLVLATAKGGSAPYTFSFSGLPPTVTAGYAQWTYAVSGNKANGELPPGSANRQVTWWQRLFAQLTGGSPGGPDPDGREYEVQATVTDANGDTATQEFTWTVDPLVADVQTTDACACFDGVRNCDVHAGNQGPDKVPVLTMTANYTNITYGGDFMTAAVLEQGQNPIGAPQASTQVNGGQITWGNNGTVVNPGGEMAAWPNIQITGGNSATRTANATAPFNIDPDPSNNTNVDQMTNQCDNKTVSPEGPVCEEDKLLYVISVGQTGVNTFDFTDTLHPCLDPATVTGLMPSQCQVQGQNIVCTGIPLSTQMPTAMISFTVQPKASCPVGTDITNSGTANFPQGGANASSGGTNQTSNRFCPCDDKSPTCTAGSSSRRSSSSQSSRSSLSSRSSSRSSSSSSVRSSSTSSPSSSRSSSASSLSSSRSSLRSNSSASSARSPSVSSRASSSVSSSRSSSRSSSAQSSDSAQSDISFMSSASSAQGSSLSLTIVVSSAPVFSVSSSSLPVSLTCGDGSLDAFEECDDGNLLDGDGCGAQCYLERGLCGDGVLQRLFGEQCEPSLASDLPCGNDCRFRLFSCGNARLDAGESCDEGARNSNLPNASCRPDCSFARCGDRIVDPGETCDDGNLVNLDGCSALCQTERAAPSSQNTLPAQIIDLPVMTSNACVTNADCAFGFCLNGRCENRQMAGEPGCQIDAQCASGRCVNNRCVACASSNDCRAGQQCVDGQCLVSPTSVPSNTGTGPASLAVMAAGAAAGYAWIRRRRTAS